MALFFVPEPASAGEPVIGVGGGMVHLTNIATKSKDGFQPLLRVDAGWGLSTNTTAKLRVEGFEADGINLTFSLVAKWQTWKYLGLFAAAGLSHGGDTRWGNNTVFGFFVRLFPEHRVSVQVDAFGWAAVRNDFLSLGVGSTLGVNYRWGR